MSIGRREDGTQLVTPAKVNHDHLNRLIEVLKTDEFASEGLGFNMATWWDPNGMWRDKTAHQCGTVACLGGTIDMLQLVGIGKTVKQILDQHIGNMSFSNMMANLNLPPTEEWLGLSYEEGDELFRPRMTDPWPAISKEAAVKVLENLRDHGIIDWRRAIEEAK